MTADVDIAYRPAGRLSGSRPGAHPSGDAGALGIFRDQVAFMAHPDARRIDVRASLRDPFENVVVRRFRLRAAIDVYAVVDLSGSLRYQGAGRKADLIASLCVALARSAIRAGDRFGLIGCNATLQDASFIAATKRAGVAEEVARALARAPFGGASAAGLAQAGGRLAGKRKMVFLISDFLLPLDDLRRVFDSLSQHDVVPVWIADSSEAAALPDWGLLELADLETGAKRVVFMRPALKRRWLDHEQQHRAAVARLAAPFGRMPVTITDSFDAMRFSRDLLGAW